MLLNIYKRLNILSHAAQHLQEGGLTIILCCLKIYKKMYEQIHAMLNILHFHTQLPSILDILSLQFFWIRSSKEGCSSFLKLIPLIVFLPLLFAVGAWADCAPLWAAPEPQAEHGGVAGSGQLCRAMPSHQHNPGSSPRRGQCKS